MKVEVIEEWYSKELLRKNPKKLFIFGDNTEEIGKGGQAVVRDEPNARGIPTKVSVSSYFSDDYYIDNCFEIIFSINRIKSIILGSRDFEVVVFPKDGLGTGLADLENKAPHTYKFLCTALELEFGFSNP